MTKQLGNIFLGVYESLNDAQATDMALFQATYHEEKMIRAPEIIRVTW
jgi:hypothetical protein